MDNTIAFNTGAASADPVLVLDKEGMIYMGQRVEDAGAAYLAFMAVMVQMRQAADPAPVSPFEGWAPAPDYVMTASRAEFFMERFKREEKLLGPHEQAAVDFVLAMLADAQRDAPAPVALRPDTDEPTHRLQKALIDAIPLGEHPNPHNEWISVRLDFVQEAIDHIEWLDKGVAEWRDAAIEARTKLKGLTAAPAPVAQGEPWIPKGWKVEYVPPSSYLTDEANTRLRWCARRVEPPYCASNGANQWTGPTVADAIRKGCEALGVDAATGQEGGAA